MTVGDCQAYCLAFLPCQALDFNRVDSSCFIYTDTSYILYRTPLTGIDQYVLQRCNASEYSIVNLTKSRIHVRTHARLCANASTNYHVCSEPCDHTYTHLRTHVSTSLIMMFTIFESDHCHNNQYLRSSGKTFACQSKCWEFKSH